MGTMARWFLLLLTGCSLTLSGPDPNRPRNKPPACDTSKALVAIDGVLAATMGIIAVAVASNNDGGAAVAPALFGTAFVASAVHGNNTVNACQRDLESYDQAMAARDIEAPQRPEPPAAAQPSPQDEPAPPEPPPQAQPAQQPSPPAQVPAQSSGDRWQAFWREVP